MLGTMFKVSGVKPQSSANSALEDLLSELTRYGRPILGVYGESGWHCSVDMHVTAIGSSFKVGSAYDLPSPREAAVQCLERVREALVKIGVEQ